MSRRHKCKQAIAQLAEAITLDAINTSTPEPTPSTFNQAKEDVRWVQSMLDEMLKLKRNGTYVEVEDEGQPTMNLTWAYRSKTNAEGGLSQRKSRCCVQGFSQTYQTNFAETYASTPYWTEIAMCLSIAAQHGYAVHQYDIEQAFIQDEADFEQYVRPCRGFGDHPFVHDKDGKVVVDETGAAALGKPRLGKNGKPLIWKVLRNWYGNKQGPRVFAQGFANFVTSKQGGGWKQSTTAPCLYVYRERAGAGGADGGGVPSTKAHDAGKGDEDIVIYMIHWVDDLLVFGNSNAKREELMSRMEKPNGGKYTLERMGVASWFLGIQMLQTEHSIELLQTSYIERMCKDIFDIESENDSVTTPFDPKVNLSKDDVPASAAERAKLSQLPFRAACGKFIYLRHTKPECAYAISQVCRFASTPTKQAWQQCRRIAQYAYNTRHRGVKFTRTTDVSELLSVRAFADASFLDCPDTARSTGGYCVFFCGNLIAFESKRLPLVTLSTAESEYVEATRCATEVAYIKELCRDFNIDLDTVPIMEDNTACIAISANPVHHQRTKHIAKYYHYCRDLVLAGEIELVGVGTKYQVADIFTKPLERDTFRRLSSVLNGYRSYAQLLVDAPTASIATMLQKTSDYANQVYHSLADHDLARYV